MLLGNHIVVIENGGKGFNGWTLVDGNEVGEDENI